MPALWLEAAKYPYQMQLWHSFHNQPCHDLSYGCPMGDFPTVQFNELRDITASVLSDVCHNVATEPRLHLSMVNPSPFAQHYR